MTRSPRLDQVKQGNPSPSETMMHFPPLFHISHRLKILISPYFRCFSAFPLFRENYSSPFYFFKFHPDFVKLTCFYMPHVLFVSLCLTMMHLCITQCTYWTPLRLSAVRVV